MRLLVNQSGDDLAFTGDSEAIVAAQQIEDTSIRALEILAKCLIYDAKLNLITFDELERNKAVSRIEGMQKMASDLIEILTELKVIARGL